MRKLIPIVVLVCAGLLMGGCVRQEPPQGGIRTDPDPAHGQLPLEVTFEVVGFDGANEYVWDFGDGSDPERGDEVTHIFHERGTYQVELTVVYGSNRTSSESVEVRVAREQLPVAEFAPPGYVVEGVEVVFDARDSYHPAEDGKIVEYQWDFGDGTFATTSTPTVTHTYRITGRRDRSETVELRVKDDDGNLSEPRPREVRVWGSCPTCPG